MIKNLSIMPIYTKEQLRGLYNLDEHHRWMEVIDENDVCHPCYPLYLRQKERILNLVPYIQFENNPSVAEFGCGNGIFGEVISKNVRSYVGIDFSNDFIALAKKRHTLLGIKNSQFFCDEVASFALSNKESFDMAFSIDFSEHFYDSDFVKIFTSIKDTLKPGGTLYIHTPNGDFILELMKKFHLIKQTLGHVGIRNFRQHVNLLKRTGFNNIRITYIPHYVRLFRRFHAMSYLPFLGRFFGARILIVCEK
jgi:SAM-dependent methyltransferase